MLYKTLEAFYYKCNMIKHRASESGEVNPLLVISIVLTVLVLGLGAFGIWAYLNYSDQKNNVDQKVAAAVADAKNQQSASDEKQFVEREKKPTIKFVGPDVLGSVQFNYPKTWSAYVNSDGTNSSNYEAYFSPGVVPPVNGKDPYALRVTIVNQTYDAVMFTLQDTVRKGNLKASSVTLAGETGTRLDGTFSPTVSGSMVVFKLRDQTLEVYTQSPSFANDYNNTILPSLTFVK